MYSRQSVDLARRSAGPGPVSGANALILGLASISTSAASSIFAGSLVLSEWPRYLSADWIVSIEFSSAMRPACVAVEQVGPAGRARPRTCGSRCRPCPRSRACCRPGPGSNGGSANAGSMLASVRDLGVVQRQQHVGRDHALDVVVGREDHVVAGIALAQLGEQLVVAREQVVADVDAGRLGEVLERGLADVGVPVVDVD